MHKILFYNKLINNRMHSNQSSLNLCTRRPPIEYARFNNSQVAFSVDSTVNVK